MRMARFIEDTVTAYDGFTNLIQFGLDAKNRDVSRDDITNGRDNAKLDYYQRLHDKQRVILSSASVFATLPAYLAVRLVHRKNYDIVNKYLAETFDCYTSSTTDTAVDASGKR